MSSGLLSATRQSINETYYGITMRPRTGGIGILWNTFAKALSVNNRLLF